MIYIDPPYGINFKSNFQPLINQREVRDKEQDLTREPETVRAYRDTWTLGIHSYLAYLRDRLAMARELLADTGSIFVQISDENLHRVRCVMDEVFKPENFISVIVVAKTSGFGDTTTLASVGDFLLWYAKDKEKMKYRSLFWLKDDDSPLAKDYKGLENPILGERRHMTTDEFDAPAKIPDGWKRFSLTATSSQGATAAGNFGVDYRGKTFQLGGDQHWKTSSDGMRRLILANRIHARENSLR
jgi:adenine-specific DNA-methyltransferase